MTEMSLQHSVGPLIELPDLPVLNQRFVQKAKEARLLEGAVLRRDQGLLGIVDQEFKQPSHSENKRRDNLVCNVKTYHLINVNW
jgi:hypothetical protein